LQDLNVSTVSMAGDDGEAASSGTNSSAPTSSMDALMHAIRQAPQSGVAAIDVDAETDTSGKRKAPSSCSSSAAIAVDEDDDSEDQDPPLKKPAVFPMFLKPKKYAEHPNNLVEHISNYKGE